MSNDGAGPTAGRDQVQRSFEAEHMKGELVASGRVGDVDWWLTAYADDERDICTDLATESPDGSGSGGGCGSIDPEEHPIGLVISGGDGF